MKFFYNGIKGNDGKLQKCFYHEGPYFKFPEGTITIFARDYGRFYGDVKAAFAIENQSDVMSDYFEGDRIRVLPDHPLYPEVLKAIRSVKERNARLKASTKEAA